MPSPLYAALVNEAIREKWIESEPVDTGRIGEKPEPGTRSFRRELRLLLKATVDTKLAERNQEFTNDLRRVPWANSQERADRASNRLLEIAEWSVRDYGEEAASMWERAARIAEMLVEDYNGWPHEAYEDIAATFFSAARGGFNEKIFRELLDALVSRSA
jgi:hypothetical protein